MTADPDAPSLTTVVDEAFVRAARRHVTGRSGACSWCRSPSGGRRCWPWP
ncbi:hypothetical protein [Cellulomonas sp. SLBN-39]|nr:hypothetical protein [Cellulomonas sp. SLBN-39]